MINAVLVQFRQIEPVYRKYPFIKTEEQVERVLKKADELKGIVIYSIVSDQLREWIRKRQHSLNIYAIDLLGPIIDKIRMQWNLVPLLKPGLFRRVEETSLQLAEAVDFTLKHDDGQGIRDIGRADLLIFGVSRTSKTPTSLYLACNYGLKVANIPIVLGIRPPEKVFRLKKPKFGFTISAERLSYIRRRRVKYVEGIDYSDLSYIREELSYSNRLFCELEGIEVIDVTHASIEEVANTIVESNRLRLKRKGVY